MNPKLFPIALTVILATSASAQMFGVPAAVPSGPTASTSEVSTTSAPTWAEQFPDLFDEDPEDCESYWGTYEQQAEEIRDRNRVMREGSGFGMNMMSTYTIWGRDKFQAAYHQVREFNPRPVSLTDAQKALFRPHFGSIVDRVRVSYASAVPTKIPGVDLPVLLRDRETCAAPAAFTFYGHTFTSAATPADLDPAVLAFQLGLAQQGLTQQGGADIGIAAQFGQNHEASGFRWHRTRLYRNARRAAERALR